MASHESYAHCTNAAISACDTSLCSTASADQECPVKPGGPHCAANEPEAEACDGDGQASQDGREGIPCFSHQDVHPVSRLRDADAEKAAFAGFLARKDVIVKNSTKSSGRIPCMPLPEAGAGSDGGVLDIASWIAGKTKKQLVELVQMTCACLHTAWASYVLSNGHSASLKGKKFEAPALRTFLTGALFAHDVFDSHGVRSIAVGLGASCECNDRGS